MSRASRYIYTVGYMYYNIFWLENYENTKKNKHLDLENPKKEHLLNPVLCYRFPIFKKKMKSF